MLDITRKSLILLACIASTTPAHADLTLDIQGIRVVSFRDGALYKASATQATVQVIKNRAITKVDEVVAAGITATRTQGNQVAQLKTEQATYTPDDGVSMPTGLTLQTEQMSLTCKQAIWLAPHLRCHDATQASGEGWTLQGSELTVNTDDEHLLFQKGVHLRWRGGELK